MRVRVDSERCQGHTLCAAVAPEVFQLRDDDGHAYVESEIVPAGLEDRVRAAASTCPERAIFIEE
ncbi:MAG: ferredoxin [Ilumatobacteraceae bacterium]